MKLFLIGFIVLGYCQMTFSQLYIADQAEFFVDTNGIVEVKGDVTIDLGGTFNMNGQELNVEGDLMQNGSFPNPLGTLRFIGIDTQTVSGNFGAENAIFNLIVSQQNESSHVNLQADIEVENSLDFVAGKIITNANEVYLKNDASDAITGHFLPNTTDGTFVSNDRYVEGNLSRDVDPSISTSYIFPIGSSEDFYNPLMLENLDGDAGKVTASFSTQALGPIGFTGDVDCSADNPAYSGEANGAVQSTDANTEVEYITMTGQGVWEINSDTSFEYDLIAYPNASNANENPSTTGQYRLLKRPSEDDASTDWTPFALSGNACVNTTNYFEQVGTGFTDFSKFGIVAAESAVLPVELTHLSAHAVDNNYIKIAWETESEINNQGFEIERSIDGKNFEKIGWQDGSGENGARYNFDDKKVIKNQLYYYRLKQFDLDGQYEYFHIVTEKIIGEVQIDIYPNPTLDEIYFQVSNDLKKEDMSLEIFDMLGRIVFADKDYFSEQESTQFSLQNANLPKGIYFLKINNVDHVLATKTLIFH